MIPHSMAVHMSKKLKDKSLLDNFISNLITTQEKEIKYLKKLTFKN